MKTTTTTKTTISCDLDGLGLVRYDEQEEEHLFITPQNMAEAAQALGCSEDLIDSLGALVEDIKQLVGQALRQIWERIDRLETIVTKTKGGD